ncbi:3'-5' exonuclease [Thiolapillus sp.]
MDEQKTAEDARLLYVGMTRAQEGLLLTSSSDNQFSRILMKK